MADLSITPRRLPPGGPQNRALRLNRARNRGRMVDTRNGFNSFDRRNFIEQATSITASTFPLSVSTVRRRYQRRGWTLQASIATANPSQ